jgi:hypothetical protein
MLLDMAQAVRLTPLRWLISSLSFGVFGLVSGLWVFFPRGAAVAFETPVEPDIAFDIEGWSDLRKQ